MLSCQVAEQFLAVKRIMKRKFEQWWSTILPTGLWFSPVSSTNKTDYHDITEILLKEAFNTINPYPR
jgi:hypothetical protein